MKTILVVDDEFGNAEILALILEDEGYRTSCAANGAQGLKRVQELRPDLMIVDYMMPIMNGAEMCHAVRKSQELGHIKILMNSGLPEASVRAHFDGYDAFLRKPYDIKSALEVIAALLED